MRLDAAIPGGFVLRAATVRDARAIAELVNLYERAWMHAASGWELWEKEL